MTRRLDPAVCVESIDLHRDHAIVTWEYVDGGIPIVADVSLEFEPADRACGISSSYWYATGDAPQYVLDLVGEAAAEAAAARREAEAEAQADYREECASW